MVVKQFIRIYQLCHYVPFFHHDCGFSSINLDNNGDLFVFYDPLSITIWLFNIAMENHHFQ